MTLTISEAAWAYLTDIDMDMRTGKRGLPGIRGMYGNFEPFAGGDPLAETRDSGLDYYVGMAEGYTADGSPLGSRDIGYGAFYGKRVFIFGQHDSGDDVTRQEMLQALDNLGFGESPGLWEAARPWRGFRDGKPVFHLAMRADSIHGVTWHLWLNNINRCGVPDGWQWTKMSDYFGILYIPDDES